LLVATDEEKPSGGWSRPGEQAVSARISRATAGMKGMAQCLSGRSGSSISSSIRVARSSSPSAARLRASVSMPSSSPP
jgi:hypothetical protein